MTTEEVKMWLSAGVPAEDLEFIVAHDEIGSDFQQQLLETRRDNGLQAMNGAIEHLVQMGIWEEDENSVSFAEEDRMLSIMEEVSDFAEFGEDYSFENQYLNTANALRKLFYNHGANLLADTKGGVPEEAEFEDNNGIKWSFRYSTNLVAPVYENLTPFDLSILDVCYTLYCMDKRIISVITFDKLLSGNKNRKHSPKKIQVILDSIRKLNSVNVEFSVRGKTYEATKLLDADIIGNLAGEVSASSPIIYLHGISNLVQYAADWKEYAAVPKAYFDTSKLKGNLHFEDTETAIILKRRVITKVMGIIRMSRQKGRKFKNWNRLSLVQQKNEEKGIFPDLGLMPDIDGKTEEEAAKIKRNWQKDEKIKYMKVVKGTLENLKANYAILDYEDFRKNPKEEIIGFDIICFTKTEADALAGMREELKPGYVSSLIAKRKSAPKE